MNKNHHTKIFIVEDNKVFASALKANIETAFSTMPLDISIFETGELCLERLKTDKPKVIILDYHLNSKYPDAIDGIQVLDIVKKQIKDIYVLMLTGDDNIDIALKSFKHGASDYIVKTDTQFRKIIFSLFNFFKIMKAKKHARVYELVLIFTCAGIAILIGVLIATGLFHPGLISK